MNGQNKCKSVLLLTQDKGIKKAFLDVAASAGIAVAVHSEWSKFYRVRQEKVYLTSDFIGKLHVSFMDNVTLVLSAKENPDDFREQGIYSFIFNPFDLREISNSFYYKEINIIAPKEIEELVGFAGVSSFIQGDYDFKFDRNLFRYKGERIYFSPSQQMYLAKWLLLGIKDNKKRSTLHSMRAKFGKEFLSEVDRFGNEKIEVQGV